MGNIQSLLTQIDNLVYENHNNEITGGNTNAILKAIANTLNDMKVDKETGKGLSQNDLTNELLVKINSSLSQGDLNEILSEVLLTKESKDTKVQNGYFQYSDGVFVSHTGFVSRIFFARDAKIVVARVGHINDVPASVAFFRGDVSDPTNYIANGSVQASPGVKDLCIQDIPEGTEYIVITNRTASLSDVSVLAAILLSINDAIREIRTAIGTYDFAKLFNVGNIVINTSGWTYQASTTRTCTKEGVTIPLNVGDTVNLRYWPANVRMYVGYRREDGTYGTSGGWVTSQYTVQEKGDYVFNFDYIADASTIASLFHIVSDSIVGFIESQTGMSKNSIYFGNRISLCPTEREQSCNVEDIISKTYADGGSLLQWDQSMAIYGNKAFLFLDTRAESDPDAGYSFAVVDLANGNILFRGNTPTRDCHNNNAQFLDVFYNEDDTYPLLLLSRGDYPSSPDAGKCYIVRIVESEGIYTLSIIKTISCTIPQARYNGSWVTDRHGNLYLYTMTIGDFQTPESAGNKFVIYRFDMFDPTDGVDITLSDNNVRGKSVFDYCVLQGGDSFGGKLFLPIQGYTKINGVVPSFTGHIIAVIDPIKGVVESMIPSDKLENEGIAIYNGAIYVSSKNGGGTSATTAPTFKIQKYNF